MFDLLLMHLAICHINYHSVEPIRKTHDRSYVVFWERIDCQNLAITLNKIYTVSFYY